MALPQFIAPHMDPCGLSVRWGIWVGVARRVIEMSGRLEFGISLISGLRTEAEQDGLRAEGRPTADNDVSTHLSCPATGVDLMPQVAVTDVVKARLGAEGVHAGLRWGGGSRVDPDTGIPSDWNHFDLGPRA